jgi:hypothetical protein
VRAVEEVTTALADAEQGHTDFATLKTGKKGISEEECQTPLQYLLFWMIYVEDLRSRRRTNPDERMCCIGESRVENAPAFRRTLYLPNP